MKIWEKHSIFNCLLKCMVSLLWLLLPLEAMGFNSDSTGSAWLDDVDSTYYDLEDWGRSKPPSDDPFESVNRIIFQANDVFYETVLNPLQEIYYSFTTAQLRQSFNGFFYNLKFPIRFLSNALQFKYEQAFYESLKFGLNTTVGILGFAQPSERFEFLRQLPEEDFGQVLAFWGVPEGPYLVVPLLGPSSSRDLPAKFFEPVINPLEAPIGVWENVDWRWLMYYSTLEFIVLSSERVSIYQSLKATSIDPYLALRSSYRQMRQQAIQE